MLEGILLTPLKRIHNEKGDIFHAMKKSDKGFNGFGEAYFSTISKGEIKGWKKHTRMTLNIIVPVGKIELVVYDGSEFFSVILSNKNYQRLTIEPDLWLAFRGLSHENMLLNLGSIEHDKDESESMELHNFNYNWN
jgi:dTDP-4-dehydrorhamnose 3,5-epimerase